MALFDFLRPRCLACNARGLQIAQAIRATFMRDGKRAPAHYTFYTCPHCDRRFRKDLGAPMRPATDDEWRTFVTNAKAPTRLV